MFRQEDFIKYYEMTFKNIVKVNIFQIYKRVNQ